MVVNTNDNRLCSLGTCVPKRFVFVILAFFGIVLVYAYKVVLSMAIVAMVGKGSIKDQAQLADTCPVSNNSVKTQLSEEGEFHEWDDHTQAIMLGGLFYGYVLTQIPGGLLAERFGAKWIFGGLTLVAAILTILGPIAAKTNSTLFLITRIGVGLAEGPVFPCINTMIAQWMPRIERSVATSVIYSGQQIGVVLTFWVSAYLSDKTFLGGWPSLFYVLGIFGFVWFVLWTLLVYEDPLNHPFISKEEYDYILKSQGIESSVSSRKRTTPWKYILTSIPVYALIITHFGQNWGFLTILTLLPTYFEKVLRMDIKQNSLMSSLPFLCQAMFAWVPAVVSDKLRERQVSDISVIRKVNNTIAFFGTAICLVAVALVGCDTSLTILFLMLGFVLNGFAYSGFNATHVDMAPDFAGTLMALTNTMANTSGFAAPLVASLFYRKGHTLTNWSHVFYLSAAIYVFTGLIYVLFASAALQSWGLSKDDEKILFNRNKDKIVYNSSEKTI